MNKNKRVLTSVFGVFVLALLFTVAPVMAAEVDFEASNEETGADSDNTNTLTHDNSGDVSVKNDGDVDNVASATVNTGGNDQEMNTTGGDLDTGGVDATTEWETVVNDGFGFCGCPFGGEDTEISADFENMLTGYNSDNHNRLRVLDNGDKTVRNMADILNSLGLNANTGDNDQNMNTEAGSMTTGDVGADIGISNWANTTNDSDSNGGGLSVDFTASNDTTGADSDNTNRVTVDNSGRKRVTNRATLNNVINVTAHTGGNDQEKNTTAGNLVTGNVDVVTDIHNIANSGTCCVSGGETSVSVDSSNETTGYNSENHNAVTVKNDGNKTVTNTANVDNVLTVEATTGNNDQNKNTTGGDVETGSVSIDFGSTTVVNSTN